MDRLTCFKHLPRYTESKMIINEIKESPSINVTVAFSYWDCSSFIFNPVVKHFKQKQQKEGGLICIYFQATIHHWVKGSLGRNWSRNLKEKPRKMLAGLFTHRQGHVWPAFLSGQDHLHKDRIIHNSLGLPIQIHNQEMPPEELS